MYIVSIAHLEKIKKTLVDANKHIKNRLHSDTEERERKIIIQNEKAIKMIDDEYLNIKSS